MTRKEFMIRTIYALIGYLVISTIEVEYRRYRVLETVDQIIAVKEQQKRLREQKELN